MTSVSNDMVSDTHLQDPYLPSIKARLLPVLATHDSICLHLPPARPILFRLLQCKFGQWILQNWHIIN